MLKPYELPSADTACGGCLAEGASLLYCWNTSKLPWYSIAPADAGISAPSDKKTGSGMSPVCCWVRAWAYCCICMALRLGPDAAPFIFAKSTRSTSSLSSQDRSFRATCSKNVSLVCAINNRSRMRTRENSLYLLNVAQMQLSRFSRLK